MATNKLTDTLCKKALPREKAYKLADGGRMYLFVATTGSRVWRLAYNDENGREQVHVIGPYPLVSLARAREMRDEFKLKRITGEPIKEVVSTLKSITLGVANEEYWNSVRKDITEKHRDNCRRSVEMYFATLYKRDMRTLTKDEVLGALKALDAQGKFEYARKTRRNAKMVFDWARANGYCDSNPAAEIDPKYAFGRRKVKHFASLKIDEMPAFLDRLSYEGSLQSVLACRVLAYTWVRTKELRNMKWEQIDGDMWRIPATIMKKGREHLVPMSRQVVELLVELKLRSSGSPYVFPNDRDMLRPMSENSVLYLIGRIGYKGRMTGHGWRHMASTWANESGYNGDHIETQLAHDDDDQVRSTYNAAEYLPQRRKMLQDWADYLDHVDPSRLKGGEPPAERLAA